MGKILENQKSYKNNTRIAYWAKNFKTCPKHQKCCGKGFFRLITDYGNSNKIKMLRKMENTLGTKNLQKTIKNSRMPI